MRHTCCLTVLLGCSLAGAQESPTRATSEESGPSNGASLFFRLREGSFSLLAAGSLSEDPSATVDYMPNDNYTVGGAFHWEGNSLALSAGCTPSEDVSRYGETDSFDLSWERTGRSYGLDVYYHNERGFYRLDEFGDPVIERGIEVSGFGVGLTYSLCPDAYPLEATRRVPGKLFREGWSPLLFGSVAGQHVKGGNLIPAALQPDFGAAGGLDEASFLTVAAGGGLGYAHRMNSTDYLWMVLAAGAGITFQDLSPGGSAVGLSDVYRVEVGFGGAERDFLVSLGGRGEFHRHAGDDIVLEFQYMDVGLFVHHTW